MTADTALFVEHPLACAGVTGPVNVARLVQERQDVSHFLRVQLGIRLSLVAELPPHAWRMVPQYCRKPAHRRRAGAHSGQIGGNAPTRSIDGMADGALLVAEKERSTLLRYTHNIAVSYTHLRAHETVLELVCRLL